MKTFDLLLIILIAFVSAIIYACVTVNIDLFIWVAGCGECLAIIIMIMPGKMRNMGLW